MKNNNLLITSAKLIPEEMRNLGDLPSALYPIESKTVLQRLYEQYNQNVKNTYVVTYENSEKFDNYLQKVKLKSLKIVKLDDLKDLGNSILMGIKYIKKQSNIKQLIVNFGDTLVFENFESLLPNSYFYSEELLSETWTFFDNNDDGSFNIIDKQAIKNNDIIFKKCFVGVFCFSDIDYLEECLIYSKSDRMDSFYSALIEYNNKHKLNAIKTNSWCDIGHQEKYYNAKLGVKAREFNHITIDENRGILKKTSMNVDKFIGEILWYIKMPKDLEYASPRIFSYSLDYNCPYVAMEYYSYHTLHEILLYSDITQKEWINIFKKIKFICDDFSRYSVKVNVKKSMKDMYLDKTIQRLYELKNNNNFKMFFNNSFLINDNEYLSLDKIIEILKQKIFEILLNINDFKIIHGDLCFSNILIDPSFSFVKLIDPRGKFGDFDIYGDQRYEIAKLFHSIDGKYDYIIEELFDLNVKENKINYIINESKRNFNICDIFENVFSDYMINQRKQINLIESLLFLSMIPLHYESLRQQYVMFATGIEILSRCCDIKKSNI